MLTIRPSTHAAHPLTATRATTLTSGGTTASTLDRPARRIAREAAR